MAEVLDFVAYRARRPERVAKIEEKAADRRVRARVQARAIRDELLADLATWPAVFQRRLADSIKESTCEGFDAERERDRFVAFREFDGRGWDWGACCALSCCSGFTASAARAIRDLRRAGREYLTCRGGARRRQHAEDLRRAKDRLVKVLWLYGVPRVDRGELLAAARRHAERSIELGESTIERLPRRIARAEDAARHGRYARGPRKGQRYDEKRRGELERDAASARADLTRCREHMARDHRLLDDPQALIRAFTDCERR